jgi:hypothetical protein
MIMLFGDKGQPSGVGGLAEGPLVHTAKGPAEDGSLGFVERAAGRGRRASPAKPVTDPSADAQVQLGPPPGFEAVSADPDELEKTKTFVEAQWAKMSPKQRKKLVSWMLMKACED